MATNLHTLHTIDFEVYDSGDRQLGIASVDLPEITFKTTDTSGAGILGEIAIPTLGFTENLELTLHWRSIFEQPLKLSRQRAAMLTLRGAIEGYDAGTGELAVRAVKIETRGLPTKLALGKFEAAESGETESTFSVDYIKISINGKSCFELDKFNYRLSVDGVEQLNDLRDALGL